MCPRLQTMKRSKTLRCSRVWGGGSHARPSDGNPPDSHPRVGWIFLYPLPDPSAASRPSRHGESPKSSRRVAQVVTASRPSRHGESPRRVAQVVTASRPSRHGESPKSSRRVAQVVTASCPSRHSELPKSPQRVAQLGKTDSGGHFITPLPESNRNNDYLRAM